MHLPFDLWTKRLPRKFQDNGPRVVQGPDGTRQWVVEGHPWSGVGWSGLGWGTVSCYARAGVAEEPEPGIFRAANARYRCEDMDQDGVDAELVNGPYEQIRQSRIRNFVSHAYGSSTTGRGSCMRIERQVHHAAPLTLPDA